MKKFKDFLKYKKTFAGFITKSPKKEFEDDQYQSMFAGFISKPWAKKDKKSLTEKFHNDTEDDQDMTSLHKDLVKHYLPIGHEWGHRKAIEHYTSQGHYSLNKKIYTKEKMTPIEKSYDSHLSRALQYKTTPKDMVVHTGLKKGLESFPHQKTRQHIKLKLPAYTSTSIRQSVADGFTRNTSDDGSKIGEDDFRFSHDGTPVHPKVAKAYKALKNSRFKESKNLTFHQASSKRDTWKKTNVPKFKKLDDLVHEHTGHRLNPLSFSHKIGHEHAIPYSEKQTSIKNVGEYGHSLQIHVPKGSNGAYVAHVSSHQNENEFLLHKNARVHVHPEPKIDHDNSTVRWTGHLTHDGVKPVGKGKPR